MRQTRHSILPASICQHFFQKKNSSAISFCRHRSGQPLYLNRQTLSTTFFAPAFFFRRPGPACAFSGAHLSTKPGPDCQYLFLSERAFSRPAPPSVFPRCARGTFIPTQPSPVNYFVQVFLEGSTICQLHNFESSKSPFTNLNHVLFAFENFTAFVQNFFGVNLYATLQD